RPRRRPGSCPLKIARQTASTLGCAVIKHLLCRSGVNAVDMVVERFSDQIITNLKLNVNPALKAWVRNGPATWSQVHADPLWCAASSERSLADPRLLVEVALDSERAGRAFRRRPVPAAVELCFSR